MSKRNFFVLLLLTACFFWAIANTAEAGKPFCGDGKCSNKENSCDCPSDCAPPPTETNCTDSTDNDCDGLIDCDDPDCGQPPYIEVCNDDTDNDCDGLIDCDDEDCDGVAVCDQTPFPELQRWDVGTHYPTGQRALTPGLYDLGVAAAISLRSFAAGVCRSTGPLRSGVPARYPVPVP